MDCGQWSHRAVRGVNLASTGSYSIFFSRVAFMNEYVTPVLVTTLYHQIDTVWSCPLITVRRRHYEDHAYLLDVSRVRLLLDTLRKGP